MLYEKNGKNFIFRFTGFVYFGLYIPPAFMELTDLPYLIYIFTIFLSPISEIVLYLHFRQDIFQLTLFTGF